MKRKILYTALLLAVSTCSIIIGRNTVKTPEIKIPDTYIDTEEIESITLGNEGFSLNFTDGTGYYIEAEIFENTY